MTSMTALGALRLRLDHHIDDDDLELYALGQITDEDRRAPIEEHLLLCHACQDRLAREDEFVAAVRAAMGVAADTASQGRSVTS